MTIGISVIISTHNRPESLQRCIDHVLAQTHLPREILIVHDSPQPLSVDLAEILAVAGGRMRYHRQAAASLTASRNQGVAMSRGDVVLLLDDDVLLPRHYLQRLAAMYEADAERAIAGIGGVMVEKTRSRLTRRVWDGWAAAFGLCRWGPRRVAGRYVRLPGPLRGRLVPAWRLSGGTISVRRDVAAGERFEEHFTGYGLGEDLEFAFRVGRRHALLLAPELKVRHEVEQGGRPDMCSRGGMYVGNFLHILRHSTDPLAGTYLLFACDMAGTVLRYAIFGLLRGNRANLQFARGMLRELGKHAWRRARRALCG